MPMRGSLQGDGAVSGDFAMLTAPLRLTVARARRAPTKTGGRSRPHACRHEGGGLRLLRHQHAVDHVHDAVVENNVQGVRIDIDAE